MKLVPRHQCFILNQRNENGWKEKKFHGNCMKEGEREEANHQSIGDLSLNPLFSFVCSWDLHEARRKED